MENESQYIQLPHKSPIENNNSQSLSLFTLKDMAKCFTMYLQWSFILNLTEGL